MATLSVQSIDNDGLTPTFATAAGGGDACPVIDGAYVEFVNGSGGSITVTFVTPGTVDGDLTVQDPTVSIAAGARAKVKVRETYRNSGTGLANWTYSGVTSLTVGVFRVS